MKIRLLLLRYSHHYNLAQVTASLCITAAHCRKSTNFSNGLRMLEFISGILFTRLTKCGKSYLYKTIRAGILAYTFHAKWYFLFVRYDIMCKS
jgi:hypothetical protein